MDAVFRLSETVKVQFLVALHGFVKSHVCCKRALQCTATSANLRLAFAIESFLSRKSWPRRGRWQGRSDRDSIFALRLFSRVGGPHHQEGKGRGGGKARWPMEWRKDVLRGRNGMTKKRRKRDRGSANTVG